jgi:hypothetical protein
LLQRSQRTGVDKILSPQKNRQVFFSTLSLSQIISSEDFIFSKQPQEELNSWGDFQSPNTRSVSRGNASEINNLVQRSRGVMSGVKGLMGREAR